MGCTTLTSQPTTLPPTHPRFHHELLLVHPDVRVRVQYRTGCGCACNTALANVLTTREFECSERLHFPLFVAGVVHPSVGPKPSALV